MASSVQYHDVYLLLIQLVSSVLSDLQFILNIVHYITDQINSDFSAMLIPITGFLVVFLF